VTWEVQRYRESAASFHARELPSPAVRSVWVCEPTGPALVLGSAQRDDVVDRAACERAHVDVVRRRSGGGAVLVVPGDLLWLDVVVPADDPLWEIDVARAFLWLGEAWAAAVGGEVHTGGLVTTRWSPLVCFAGVGTGEVLQAGAKVVGLSQRRTREAARFQCAALRRWDPPALLDLLVVDDRDQAASDLARVAAGIDREPDAMLTAFLAQLP
jgi:lipoate-protein ligase A